MIISAAILPVDYDLVVTGQIRLSWIADIISQITYTCIFLFIYLFKAWWILMNQLLQWYKCCHIAECLGKTIDFLVYIHPVNIHTHCCCKENTILCPKLIGGRYHGYTVKLEYIKLGFYEYMVYIEVLSRPELNPIYLVYSTLRQTYPGIAYL